MGKLSFVDFNRKMIETTVKFRARILHAFSISQKLGHNTVEMLYNSKDKIKERGKISIRDIFKKYWPIIEDFIIRHHIKLRPSIIDNIYAMMKCGSFDIDNGYLYFECPNPNCNNFHIQPFTCKSRFCPSCGKKYNDARASEIAKKCIDVPHRHIVFTIAKELSNIMNKNRSLIDCLFEAVDKTFKFMAQKAGKNKKYKFGYILTLHTFGRDLKFNAHIHAIVAECIIDENGNRRKYDYFHYESMRKTFMYFLINSMKAKIHSKHFNSLAQEIVNKCENGFYVHGPKMQGKSKEENKKLIKYVVRYAGHPAISESRLINLDEKNNTITYYYTPHEDDTIEDESEKKGTQIVTETVDVFIFKLIKHIPDNGKHNICYYGFYANKSKVKAKIKTMYYPLFKDYETRKMASLLSWRKRLIDSYHYDILMCENCGRILEIVPNMCYCPPSFCYIRRPSYG